MQLAFVGLTAAVGMNGPRAALTILAGEQIRAARGGEGLREGCVDFLVSKIRDQWGRRLLLRARFGEPSRTERHHHRCGHQHCSYGQHWFRPFVLQKRQRPRAPQPPCPLCPSGESVTLSRLRNPGSYPSSPENAIRASRNRVGLESFACDGTCTHREVARLLFHPRKGAVRPSSTKVTPLPT